MQKKHTWLFRNAPVLPLFQRCLLFWQKAGMAQTIRAAHSRIPLVMISYVVCVLEAPSDSSIQVERFTNGILHHKDLTCNYGGRFEEVEIIGDISPEDMQNLKEYKVNFKRKR